MSAIKRQLPNALSLSRTIFVIPFVIALRYNNLYGEIFSILLILATDFLDGTLARQWNSVSPLGKILDPLADKICIGVAAIGLVIYAGFPIWLFAAIVARDLLIMAGGLIIIRDRNLVPTSNLTGKVTVNIIAFCLIIYLLRIESIKGITVAVTLAAVVASFVSYMITFIKVIARKNNGTIIP